MQQHTNYHDQINSTIFFSLIFYQLSRDVFQFIMDMKTVMNENSHLPSIYLLPLKPMISVDGVLGEILGLTRFIGRMEGDVVLSKTKLGMILY